MKYLLATSLVVMSFSVSAHAEDFTGPRIEAHVGWEQVGAEGKYDDGVDVYTVGGDKSGVAYGVGVGYDVAITPGMIAGVEANFDLSDTKKCGEVYGLDRACLKAKRDIELSARLGQKLSPNVLFYLKAGYVNGKFAASYVDFEDILPSYSESDTRSGYRLGAGVEALLGSNAYIKAEYRYTDYGNWKFSDVDGDYSIGFDRHQILGGIGYRF